ncbi:MAG: aminodeoxychorismate synthase, component I, partial [Sphingomonadaceae bacterium]
MPPLDLSRPFVLFDDASAEGGDAILYREPLETIVVTEASDILPALERLRSAVRAGRHVAGYLSYEAGSALEPCFTSQSATPG